MTNSPLRAYLTAFLTAHELEALRAPVDAAENIFEPGFEIAFAMALGLKDRFSVEVEWAQNYDDFPFDAWALVAPTQTAYIAPEDTPLDRAEALMARVAEMISVQVLRENAAAAMPDWKIIFGCTFRGVDDFESVDSGFLLSIHAEVGRI